MKKSKLFIGAGALLLAITAIFSTKANKKFNGVNTAYMSNSNFSASYFITGLASLNLSVTGTNPAFLTLYTTGGTVKFSGQLATLSGTLLDH